MTIDSSRNKQLTNLFNRGTTRLIPGLYDSTVEAAVAREEVLRMYVLN